ncbi:MAG: lactate racemase domain-containing protein, partial [Dehalococcoidia bacterium]
MKSRTVRLPQLAWYDDDHVELRFPSTWEIDVCYMKGHRRPPVTESKIRAAFSNPIGTAPIRELARGKKEVVILFDDMSRPTRAAEIVPHVLDELKAAGISDDHIRFIAALGAHGALTRLDFAKKLGEAALSRFPVYNHNPYENCTFIGNTSNGTPVSVNSEVMSCDLKIGIGCILPHPLTGFGGGSKIVLP